MSQEGEKLFESFENENEQLQDLCSVIIELAVLKKSQRRHDLPGMSIVYFTSLIFKITVVQREMVSREINGKIFVFIKEAGRVESATVCEEACCVEKVNLRTLSLPRRIYK